MALLSITDLALMGRPRGCSSPAAMVASRRQSGAVVIAATSRSAAAESARVGA